MSLFDLPEFLTEFAPPEKEELLALIIRHCPAAIAVFDHEIRYIAASDKWMRDYGLEGRHIKGRSHYEIFPELLHMPQWRSSHLRTLAGDVESSPCDRFEREDGSVDYVRWENRPWYRDGGQIGGMIMFTEVITEQVKLGKHAERQQRYLQKAERMARLGHWSPDLSARYILGR